ncbi:unnamed protein product [Adineta steineri]|uniref:G-protein coupled receptors family 1 profile domain-containing protein n=1 Tax=Adineta steineri TaxID=433720 RepID=A0A819AHT6_9BILA|nr:unnamed protein product [Adineta steineri]CAF1411386.1 unnamed protein product [Adineta steineri]CAF3780127.1 unnamed protein product [Adineta steineri]CAF3846402.1 unnamed protein product [Adineta steineri]
MNQFVTLRDIVLLSLYALTSILSLIGNAFVFRISLRRHNHMWFQSTTNFPFTTSCIFLLNLAIADTLLGLTIPVEFVFCSKYFVQNITASSYVCAGNKSMQTLAYNVSTLTICLIAYDRYRLIENPLEKYYPKKPFPVILLTWIFSGLFAATCFVSTKVNIYFNSYEKLICSQILYPLRMKYFSNDTIYKIRSLCLILLFYIIPLLIITSLCLLTIRIISRRTVIGVREFQTFKQSRTRSISLLMITIIVFTLSHSPIHFIYLRDIFHSSSKVSLGRSIQITKCQDSTMYLLFYWLSISGCCYNSIIYSWFNRKYQNLVYKCCRLIVCCERCNACSN